jgi:rfaE bifunctional protein nucleotidyltransferase chain/domain/rfaE bifunctional protein kinase chain/domain
VTRLVVIGDALLDRDLDGRAERLAPDAPVPVVQDVAEHPRPGGAGLAAALAAGDPGMAVTLICALGDDAAGSELARLLAAAGVEVCDLGSSGATPEKVRVRASGRAVMRIDRGGPAGIPGPLTHAARAALARADAVLVSDYGRGMTSEPTVRAALASLPSSLPLVWDPHPRGSEPVPGVLVVTPNAAEAAGFAAAGASSETPPDDGAADAGAAARHGRELARRWRVVDVCVTMGARGALLIGGDGPPLAISARSAAAGDPCGAGDCFAATVARRLAQGGLPSEAVQAGVTVAAEFVAAGGAGAAAARGFAPAAAPAAETPAELAARIRARGGTVVATGGCFDILHAGHVQTLQAARALGDCLIVCLNSDASVRRLKGADRPVVEQEDRATMLRALACVDAVAIFDQDDPREVLRELRPHVWAKGGDYAMSDLPEAETLSEWGGRPVIVPYVAGRSTTRLIEEVVARAR